MHVAIVLDLTVVQTSNARESTSKSAFDTFYFKTHDNKLAFTLLSVIFN